MKSERSSDLHALWKSLEVMDKADTDTNDPDVHTAEEVCPSRPLYRHLLYLNPFLTFMPVNDLLAPSGTNFQANDAILHTGES